MQAAQEDAIRQRQEQAEAQALEFAKLPGADPKKVLAVFGDSLSEQGRAKVELLFGVVKAEEARKKEALAFNQTGPQAAQGLAAAIAAGRANPSQQGGMDIANLLSQIGQQYGDFAGPITTAGAAGASEIEANQAERTRQLREQQSFQLDTQRKSGAIDLQQQLVNRRTLADAEVREQAFQNAVAQGAQRLLAAETEKGGGARATVDALRKNPLIGSDPARAFNLMSTMLRGAGPSLMADAATKAEYRSTGVAVPDELIAGLSTGKSFKDDRFASLGLPGAPILRDPTPGTKNSNVVAVQSINRVVDLVASMEAAAQLLAEEIEREGGDPNVLTKPIEDLKEASGASRALYSAYQSLADLSTLGIGTGEGGKQVSEFEARLYQSMKPYLSNLKVGDVVAGGGGLAPSARGRIFGMRRFVESRYYPMTPMPRDWVSKRLDEAYKKQVQLGVGEIRAGLTEWRPARAGTGYPADVEAQLSDADSVLREMGRF